MLLSGRDGKLVTDTYRIQSREREPEMPNVFNEKNKLSEEFLDTLERLDAPKKTEQLMYTVGRTFGWDVVFEANHRRSSNHISLWGAVNDDASNPVSSITIRLGGVQLGTPLLEGLFDNVVELFEILPENTVLMAATIRGTVLQDAFKQLIRHNENSRYSNHNLSWASPGSMNNYIRMFQKQVTTLATKYGLPRENRLDFIKGIIVLTNSVRSLNVYGRATTKERIASRHLSNALKTGYTLEQSVFIVRNKLDLTAYVEFQDLPAHWFAQVKY